ncbi:hypothetical protein SKAU_G00307320 [Synaphobranchus kaupii]|uniref:Uncharacterized protein n=1 Tax=Synaphobranchus kaupii TaxID=118154 RepID=A0A9Q1ER15_SYNKA|nr:hypothetical protein SKAU_G00307320 [Synaphobranchus kaupii]
MRAPVLIGPGPGPGSLTGAGPRATGQTCIKTAGPGLDAYRCRSRHQWGERSSFFKKSLRRGKEPLYEEWVPEGKGRLNDTASGSNRATQEADWAPKPPHNALRCSPHTLPDPQSLAARSPERRSTRRW